MIERFLKNRIVGLLTIFGLALMSAHAGWKSIMNPPMPPFRGKGAWLYSLLHEIIGPMGIGGFDLLVSFSLFALLALILVKEFRMKFGSKKEGSLFQ